MIIYYSKEKKKAYDYVWHIPPVSTRMDAPVLSWIDLITDPCFPIILIACEEDTNNRTEHNAVDAKPVPSLSSSGIPLTRLNTLRTAAMAGEISASGSSLPDIRT